jgi:hypothetical protein
MRRLDRMFCILVVLFSLSGGYSWAGEPLISAWADAMSFNCPPRCIPPPYCPQPQPSVAPAPPSPEQPPTTEPSPTAQPSPSAEPTLPFESGLALGGETFAAAPNMIGHLLMGSRSVSFRYNRAAGAINVADFGSTNITNPSVADNESPLPRDRISFRFNYFDDAQQVTGFAPAVFNSQGVGTSFSQTRSFSVERYTFSFEKTFLNQWGSVELRVPFSTGLSSNLNLSAGDITGPPTTDQAFNVTSTPDRTLGSEGTQFENMTLILKGLLYRRNALAVSAGLALGIPTGDDTNVRIVDYSGSTTAGQATVQRERVIRIDNEAWSLSPFVAALYTPTNRFFTQGFLQFDLPLNTNTINYSDRLTRGTGFPIADLAALGLLSFPSLDQPFSARSGISEQPLMQVDWGVGYWLLRDSSRTWITGIAPSLELHYTTTLKNASVVTLPGDSFLQIDPSTGNLIQEQPPRVGNLRNRVDILDMTVASTILVSDRATLATGFSFPLKGRDDRTFDWEFHLQLNYYFGGIGRRFAPTF